MTTVRADIPAMVCGKKENKSRGASPFTIGPFSGKQSNGETAMRLGAA